MARGPDDRQEQAKELFLQGMKLIDISNSLEVPVGTIRSWKKRYNWASNPNATLQKKKRNVAKAKGGQRGNQNASETMALPRNKIKTQSLQESLRLSFLIIWNQKKSNWSQRFRMTRKSFSSRRSSF